MRQISRYQAREASADPPYSSPRYLSSLRRAPAHQPIAIPQTLSELTGPSHGREVLREGDDDLTRNARTGSPALGERIVVAGRVLQEDGRPVASTLVEIWQANAAGRYPHCNDRHDAPLDPNFLGAGRLLTDADGWYRFTTIKPGAYPWANHYNAWRPAHIHFSLFGPAFATRLITQMYFPGDPLLDLDGIYMSIPDPAARQRLVARYDHERTEPHHALGYRFDLVLRGREETPLDAL